jgi:hypothetical protein
LQPLSDTEFYLRELNAYFTFRKDDSGKVNAIRIKFAGNDKDAIRIKE